ncbi:MAG: PEP-CTERM sorting domain-containing protein [Phenylobacterium sp.]
MALLAGLAFGAVGAAPAQAQPLDCFEWVRASAARIIHPHRVHHVRPHKAAVPHKVRVRVHVRPHRHVHRIASPYVKRPIACPERHVAIASPVPGVEAPETPETMIAQLAGPPTATEAVTDTAAAAPAPPVEEQGFPFLPGLLLPGGPGLPIAVLPPVAPAPGPTLPGTPPPVVPPETPPVVAPPVTGPPVTPPVAPPLTPPVAPPETFPVTPPVAQPFTVPPVLPPSITQPPTAPGPVPEPQTWSFLLVGFAALGLAVRRKRRPVVALRT